MLPLTTQKKALVQQTIAYFLTGTAHGPIQIIPASVCCLRPAPLSGNTDTRRAPQPQLCMN